MLSNWTVGGFEVLVQVIIFACCLTSRLYRCATPAILVSESKTILNAFLKDVSFGAPLNLHTLTIHSWNSFDLDSAWIKFSLMSFFLFLPLPRACTDAAQQHFAPQNQTLCLMVFKRCQVWNSIKSFKVSFTRKIQFTSTLC